MFKPKAGEEGWPDTAKSRVFFLPGTQVGQVPIFDTYTTAIYTLLWFGEGEGGGKVTEYTEY